MKLLGRIARIVEVAAPLIAATLFFGGALAGPNPGILVELTSDADIGAVAQRYSLTVVDGVPELRIWAVEPGSGFPLSLAVEVLGNDADVENVEVENVLQSPEGVQISIPDLGVTADEEDVVSQPAACAIQVGEAQEHYRGTGVLIAILDNGIDAQHPMFRNGPIEWGRDFAGGDGTTFPQPDGLDGDGDGLIDEALHHGTYVAGLIRTVAPGARLLPVRVLDSDGVGTSLGLVRGLLFAADRGADVINLSLEALEESELVRDIVIDLTARGIVIVAAAGNRDCGTVGFPAKQPEVIAVAAVDAAFSKAYFSNHGSEVDLSAPGEDLLSTYDHDAFALWDGTSFATALVSAGAALILEKYPGLSPAEVESLLGQGATPIPPDGSFDGNLGEGVLDVEGLVHLLAEDRTSLRIRSTPEGASVEWSPVLNAGSYDLARGELAGLADGDDGETTLGPLLCLADDLTSESLFVVQAIDPESPDPGRAFYYVVRDDIGDAGYATHSDGRSRSAPGSDCSLDD